MGARAPIEGAGIVSSLRRPGAVPSPGEGYERWLGEVTIGTPQRLSGPVQLCAYDAAWPGRYHEEEALIVATLGDRVGRLEHVGSTSVPGLVAKPVIDVVLEVADAAEEPAYLPELEAAGYVLSIREPEWFEHRLLRRGDRAVNVHVFSQGCPETDRMARFRDWLRAHPADRERYAQAKQELAARPWTYMQQYADAKTDVIAQLLAHADGP